MAETKLSRLLREAAGWIEPDGTKPEAVITALQAEADRLDAGPQIDEGWFRAGWLAACGGEAEDGK